MKLYNVGRSGLLHENQKIEYIDKFDYLKPEFKESYRNEKPIYEYLLKLPILIKKDVSFEYLEKEYLKYKLPVTEIKE